MSLKLNFHVTLVRSFVRQAAQVSGVLMLLLGMLFVPTRTAHAGPPITMTVNTTADSIDASPGNGVCANSSGYCSLRAAIMEANANPGSTILFDASLNTTPIVLTLTGNDYTANAGDLDINASTNIVGNGASNTIIQAATNASYAGSIQDKVFGVNQSGLYPNLTVSFSGLTIRYGDNNIPTSDLDYAYTGGGVDVYFTGSGNSTTFTDCVISNNRSRTSYGGGLNVDSSATGTNTLTLTNVTFSNNNTMSTASTSHGGALNVYGNNVTVNISNNTFTNNTVPAGTSYGGAINSRPNSGSLTIDRTFFSGNSAWYGGAIFADSGPVTITYSRIVGNTAAVAGSGLYVDGSTVTAENNWWGCSTGPGAAPCDTAILLSGTQDFNPWLRDNLTVLPDPLALVTNQSAALTASFLTNSSGGAVSTSNLTTLIGRSVTWAASFGTLSEQQTTVQSSGTATATFRASSAGSTVISAKVDNDSTSGTGSNILTRTITIGPASTTTAITSDLPDPSLVGQAVTVAYSVTGAYGNTPTAPIGNVTVSDGVNNCVGTVATGSCTITLSTAGVRTLTATYAGDANFNGSTSAGISHTVNQAPSIISGNTTTFTVGSAGTFTVTTTGFPTGASMTISETGPLPSGVTFTDNGNGTATLAGTPAAGTSGTHPITITASNGVSPDAVQNFTLTVNTPPVITSADNTTFVVGTAGSFTVTTTPGYPVATTITRTGTLPSGVTFGDNGNGTATLSGTPASGTGGTYPFTITASNGVSPNATQSFTLTINADMAPAITSANSTSFTVGAAGSFTVTTNGYPDPAIIQTGALPSGIAFTDNGNGTATLAGIPAAGTSGTYNLTFTASNGILPNATQNFTLTVGQVPAFTNANNTFFTVESAGTFTITTTGYPIPAITRGGAALPGGVTFVDNGDGSATLSGTPAAGSSGTYNLTFTASNGILPNATQNFTFTVNQAPAITSANSTSFTVGAAGSFTVTTNGYPDPAIIQTGALPAGVTFTDNGNGTATLAGTPAAGTSGTYDLTFTASNGVPPNATQSFTLTVGQVPAFTNANNTFFTVGFAGTFTITTTGYPIPAITRGGAALPGGMTFVDNGDGSATLSGTPAAGSSGTYNLTFTASNGILPNATQNFTLTVNQAPAITSSNSASFVVGAASSFTVTTSGYPLPAITRGGAALPGGVTFTDNGNGTATLAGTPTGSGGIYNLTFTASNGILPNATQNFTLTVGQVPAITSPNNVTFVAGNPSSFTVTTTGIPAPTLSHTGTLPSGVTFTNNGDGTATLAGTPVPGSVGVYNLIFTAQNGIAPNATQNFTLTVDGPPGVHHINSVADTGDGRVLENERTDAAITQLLVVFNKSINSSDASSLGNYQLIRDASTPVAIDSVVYDPATQTATVLVNGSAALPDGGYTFTVNGAIRDTLGVPIGSDFVRNFYVVPVYGSGTYDDTHEGLWYTGSWLTYSGTGPYSNTMHYTNASGATVNFSFQAPAQFTLFFQKAANRSNILISVDGGAAVPVSAYNATGLWQQSYTSAMYTDTGSHTVTITTPGDGKYIDIDAVQIVAAPTPQGVGVYDDANAAWTYAGTWSTWSGTGPRSNTMHYTNASGATASFAFQAPAKFILFFQKAANRSNILVSVDGGAPTLVNAYSSSSAWQQTYTSLAYTDSGNHTVTITTPGDGKYIDIDAIQIITPTDLTKPAAISLITASTGTTAGSVNLNWTAVGDDGMTGTATSYQVRYSTTAINSEATWNAATPVISGIPTPLLAGTPQSMTVSGLTPNQIYYFAVRAQDEEPNLGDLSSPAFATTQALEAVGVGTYDDTNAAWTYAGSWSTWSGTGPYNNSMHYTNASGATASFTFQAPAQFILFFQKAANRSNILISVDGGTATEVSTYSSSALWQQTYMSAMYTDSGSHTVRISTPGDGKYIDIDAIKIAGPPAPQGVGTYDDTNAAWTYGGSWSTWSGTGPHSNTMHYTNASGATASFAFQAPARFILFFQKTANRSNILISVDGGTAIEVSAYNSSGLWQQSYASAPYTDTGSHTVTISTPGDGSYIDVDAIQIVAPPTPQGRGTYDDANAAWTYSGSWGTYSGTGPYASTLHYSNATGATASFTFQGPAKFIFTYSTNTNRGSILISVDGGTPVSINANGSALWLQTYTSATYTDSGSHTVTISTPGDGSYIDVDAIQISP